MRFTRQTLRIEFIDGSIEEYPIMTRGEAINPGDVEYGVLHAYSQNGDMAPRVHVGSWPLCNIRKYRFEER